MPYYNFRNKETNEEFTEFLSMSELDQYLADNPHLEQLISYAKVIYRADGAQKPEGGFRDLLKQIRKSNSRGITQSNINTF